MFRVLSASIIRITIKTADAIIGTVYVSVWFKSVERCPKTGVYFTVMAKLELVWVVRVESIDCTPDDGCRKYPKHVQ
jgi:hypothetical protein